MTAPAIIEAFDYAALPAEVAADAKACADRFRAMHRTTMENIIAMGRDLAAIKARLEHGQFIRWLGAEFEGVARTAQNYMMVAERFADKSELVSHFPPSTIYRLAAPSTPDEVRDEVVRDLSEGKQVAPADVAEKIRDARDKAKAEAVKRKAAPKDRKKIERREARAAADAKRWEAEAKERDHALMAVVELIRSRLGPDDLTKLASLGPKAVTDWSWNSHNVLWRVVHGPEGAAE